MGKKRGFHIVRVRGEVSWLNYYSVDYKRSKCRHALIHTTYVKAIDELDAYQKAKEEHVL